MLHVFNGPSEGPHWILAAPRETARTLKEFQGTQELGRQDQNAMERMSTLACQPLAS